MDAHKQSEPEAQPGEKSEAENGTKDETGPSPPSPAPIPAHWGHGGYTGHNGLEASRTIERALKSRWPITDTMREEIPVILARIIRESSDVRAVTNASRVLAYMDGLNLQQEKRDTGEEHISAVVHIRGEDIQAFAADVIAKRLAFTEQPSPGQSGRDCPDGATPEGSTPG